MFRYEPDHEEFALPKTEVNRGEFIRALQQAMPKLHGRSLDGEPQQAELITAPRALQ